MHVAQPGPDTVSVEMVPDDNDQEAWVFLAHLSSILYRDFGLDLDCDRIVITLVYDDEDGREATAPQSAQN